LNSFHFSLSSRDSIESNGLIGFWWWWWFDDDEQPRFLKISNILNKFFRRINTLILLFFVSLKLNSLSTESLSWTIFEGLDKLIVGEQDLEVSSICSLFLFLGCFLEEFSTTSEFWEVSWKSWVIQCFKLELWYTFGFVFELIFLSNLLNSLEEIFVYNFDEENERLNLLFFKELLNPFFFFSGFLSSHLII